MANLTITVDALFESDKGFVVASGTPPKDGAKIIISFPANEITSACLSKADDEFLVSFTPRVVFAGQQVEINYRTTSVDDALRALAKITGVIPGLLRSHLPA